MTAQPYPARIQRLLASRHRDVPGCDVSIRWYASASVLPCDHCNGDLQIASLSVLAPGWYERGAGNGGSISLGLCARCAGPFASDHGPDCHDAWVAANVEDGA